MIHEKIYKKYFALRILKEKCFLVILCVRAIQYLRGQDEGGKGVKNISFCPCLGYKNCPRRADGGGEFKKKWQNSVHVVVECPLTSKLGQRLRAIFSYEFFHCSK